MDLVEAFIFAVLVTTVFFWFLLKHVSRENEKIEKKRAFFDRVKGELVFETYFSKPDYDEKCTYTVTVRVYKNKRGTVFIKGMKRNPVVLLLDWHNPVRFSDEEFQKLVNNIKRKIPYEGIFLNISLSDLVGDYETDNVYCWIEDERRL